MTRTISDIFDSSGYVCVSYTDLALIASKVLEFLFGFAHSLLGFDPHIDSFPLTLYLTIAPAYICGTKERQNALLRLSVAIVIFLAHLGIRSNVLLAS